MKVFQILGSMVHYELTNEFPTLESTIGYFAPNIIIVEAPDYVHQGWGFDDTKNGDARFIEPTPPEGWLYDKVNDIFYQDIKEIEKTPEQLREIAYRTEKLIDFNDKSLTVDEANTLFLNYFAEGKVDVYEAIRHKINDAKSSIRERYPDETEES